MIRSRYMRRSSIRTDYKQPKMHQVSSIQNPQQQSNLLSLCQCNLCDHKNIPKYLSNLNLPPNKSISISSFDKTSLQIILSSLLGKNKKKGLNINLPETCFYKNGKPETMYIHNLQQIKAVSVKKFTSRQVLQDFLKRRLEARLNINQLNHNTSKELSEMHQKLFQKVHPSHLQCVSSQELKQKIYIIHKNSKIQIPQQKQENNGECCVSYFSDGSIALLAQDQFKVIRNDSKYFQTLQYIQVLIPAVETVVSQFDQYSCINHKDLFNSARAEIDNHLEPLNMFTIRHRNSDEYQQLSKVLKHTPSKFALYQTFRIVHYINKTTNMVICSLKLNWSFTKERQIYLLNVISMNYRMRETNQIKKILVGQLQLIKKRNSSQLKNIESMQEIMMNKWKLTKIENSLHQEESSHEVNKEQTDKIATNINHISSLKTSMTVKPVKYLPRLFKIRSSSRKQFI